MSHDSHPEVARPAPTGGDEPDRTRTGQYAVAAIRPGDLLAGRFRIVRFIARGGMGEVYEAEDLELREHVALKTISEAHLSDARALDRFRREVQLARKITHPNVCRTFDVFKAGDPRGARELTFVTMELLRGETLADELRQRGRLPVSRAAAIAQQVGAGLQAAHAAGVIHRDLKSRNIVLAEGGSAPQRAVVTDFGIAVSMLPADTATTSSDGLHAVGTPAYMAPEQISGAPATRRTDVYAFGVVLFEMVTGALPFDAETPLGTALKRLSEAPPDPRERVPELPAHWADTILRCLATDPADRFESIADVLAALTLEHRTGRRPLRPALVIASLAFLATAAVGSYLMTRAGEPSRPASGASAATRQTVALLGFRNISDTPETNYISTLLSEGLATELGFADGLRTVPGESVERMKMELGISPAETLALDTLRRIRLNLATDLVVLGSYLARDEDAAAQVTVFVRVQDSQTGEVVTSLTRSGSQHQLPELIAEAGTALRTSLAGGSARPAASTSRAALPTGSTAQRLYAEGLDALRRFDARTARDLLEKAVAQQPDFPLAHSALSAAWADLGYDAQATRAAASALQFAAQLPATERQWIEGLYREASREWDRAVEIYEALLQGDPQNLEYGLRLSAAQVAAGRSADARRTAERLRAGVADPDPRVLLAEAIASGAGGDYRAQQDTANAAAAVARRHGSPLLVARALVEESGALLRLGRRKEAAAASETARQLYQEGGDRRGVARALIQQGNVFRADGRMDLAEAALRDAVDIGRDLGNRRHTARALNDLANVYFDQRQYQLAAEMYDDVLQVAREVGDRYTESRALNNLASARYALGHVAVARRLDEQALAIQRELGNRSRIAFSLINMAESAFETADLDGAQRMYEEALAINRDLDNKGETAFALEGLSRVLAVRGRSERATEAAAEAVRIRRELADEQDLTESLVTDASVAAEAGDTDRAIAQLRTALSSTTAGDETRLRAAALLTRLLIARREVHEAEAVFTTHIAAVDLSDLPHGIQLTAAIARGRMLAARGDVADGEKVLREAAARGRALELRTYELQARFELASSRLATASAAARRELQTIEHDARQLGFVTVGRRAAELSAGASATAK